MTFKQWHQQWLEQLPETIKDLKRLLAQDSSQGRLSEWEVTGLLKCRNAPRRWEKLKGLQGFPQPANNYRYEAWELADWLENQRPHPEAKPTLVVIDRARVVDHPVDVRRLIHDLQSIASTNPTYVQMLVLEHYGCTAEEILAVFGEPQLLNIAHEDIESFRWLAARTEPYYTGDALLARCKQLTADNLTSIVNDKGLGLRLRSEEHQ